MPYLFVEKKITSHLFYKNYNETPIQGLKKIKKNYGMNYIKNISFDL